MCGICGMVSLTGDRPDESVLGRMVGTLAHRGPDDNGYMVSGPCGLGSTRLAIIDLSEAGHMPMHVQHKDPATAENRDTWIVYNGEAYNFSEIRSMLQAMGHEFFSGTDTETLLRSYIQFGVPNFIKPFRGMFALAIWDETRQRLVLMRDRLGQKPLYYSMEGGWLVFGSEIKSLLSHPAVPKRLNQKAIPYYLAYGYPPSPETMFEGIYALPPGYMLTFDLSDGTPDISIDMYWEPPFPESQDEQRDEENIATDLLAHLRGAVRMRMIADVPLGAFLSGGLDSAAIVALMSRESGETVKTFSMGFEGEDSFDETYFARKVAGRFVTDHHEFIVKPNVLDLLDELVYAHDQPFGDSSAIPTYLVSKLARDHVTVVLTGDGGDELFAGYDRFRAAQLIQVYSRLPEPVQKAVGEALGAIPRGNTTYGSFFKRADRFTKAAHLPLSEAYLSWVRYVSERWVTALMGADYETQIAEHYDSYSSPAYLPADADLIARLLDVNMRTYLPDDLLVKVDRCSMAVSLEARSPFLDHHLVQFASQIPSNLKMKRSSSKYILKQALRGILPDSIIDRKKHGFGVPVGAWFRGELSDYIRDVLTGEKASRRGIFDVEAVYAMLDAHQNNKADLGQSLWTLLTFELWMQQYFD